MLSRAGIVVFSSEAKDFSSFCIFFPANDIVSYREFISSPLHVRLKQLRAI